MRLQGQGRRFAAPLWLTLHLVLMLGLFGMLCSLPSQAPAAGLWVLPALKLAGDSAFWIGTGKAVLETLAIALWATALGALGGAILGALASKSQVRRDRRPLHRLQVGLARLCLDALRAVPDFAWALLLLTLLGAGPVTGLLALALSNAGILGRLYSEQWENLSGPGRALATTGTDSRLLRFFYVHRVVLSAPVRSYTMLRLECTVRNASVIGVVGGGGLGGQIFEAFSLGEQGKALVLFVVLCLVAGWTEMGSGRFVRGLSARRQTQLFGLLLMASLGWLAPDLSLIYERLARTNLGWAAGIFKRLLTPDLSLQTMKSLAGELVLPVSLAYLSTMLAMVFAYLFAFPLAHSPQSRWGWSLTRGSSPLQGALASLGRWVSLVLRTLPVEGSVLIFAFVWGLGWKSALAALWLHSAALLLRLFYDVLDGHDPGDLEHRGSMRRSDWWAYVVGPQLWPRWRSFVFFLGDANLRSGIVLGMIGVGGIGDRFHTSLSFWRLGGASSCLLWMLLLSLLSDRLARYVATGARRGRE